MPQISSSEDLRDRCEEVRRLGVPGTEVTGSMGALHEWGFDFSTVLSSSQAGNPFTLAAPRATCHMSSMGLVLANLQPRF